MVQRGRTAKTVAGAAVGTGSSYLIALYATYQDKQGHDFAWHLKTAAATPWWLWMLGALTIGAVLFLFWPAIHGMLHLGQLETQVPPTLSPSGKTEETLLQFTLQQLTAKENELKELRQKLQQPPWQDLMANATREAAESGRTVTEGLVRERDHARVQAEALSEELAAVRHALEKQSALVKKLHDDLRNVTNERDDALRRVEELRTRPTTPRDVPEAIRPWLHRERGDAVGKSQAVERPGARRTLKQAAFALADEIRRVARGVPDNLKPAARAKMLSDIFHERIWDRYMALKRRMVDVLGPQVVSAPERLAGESKDKMLRVAANLEVEALRLPEGLLE